MKISCGTDIIEIERIQEAIEKLGSKFIQEIYTQEEITYCENKKNAKYEHYAARFAAKEAVFKAVSIFLQDKYSISWKNAEILNDKNQKPYIHFINMEFPQIKSIDISISHCKQYAVANVVVMYEEVMKEENTYGIF